MDVSNLQKISVEDAMEDFKREGLDISIEETELVLDFLYSIISLVIKEYFDNE